MNRRAFLQALGLSVGGILTAKTTFLYGTGLRSVTWTMHVYARPGVTGPGMSGFTWDEDGHFWTRSFPCSEDNREPGLVTVYEGAWHGAPNSYSVRGKPHLLGEWRDGVYGGKRDA
jgi:hypothetical protein